MSEIPERFRMVRDDDGHTYVIPADKEDDFHAWVEASGGDMEDYEGIDFEKYSLGGCPSVVTFEKPEAWEKKLYE
jgi:hypothetical protein